MVADTPIATQISSSRSTRSWSREWLLRVMSVALGVIAAALLLEALMWAFAVQPARVFTKRILLKKAPSPERRYDCYPSNPHGDFQPLPDTANADWSLYTCNFPPSELPMERLRETPWCVEYSNFDLTMREAEYSWRASSDELRIAVLGDSFVYGEGVPLERTLTRQAQQLLGPGYEWLNLGASGWNTHRELTALEQYVPLLHARRAIVVFTANDVEITAQLDQRQKFINDLVNLRDENLLRHEENSWYNVPSRLVQFVGRNLEMRRIRNETIQWYKDLYDPLYNQDNLEKLADDMRRMQARTDCQVVLVLYPLMEGLEKEYPLAEVHRKVSAMAQSVGLPVFDLAPAFAGQRTRDLWVHESDHHPNSKAHAIAAKALVAWLRTLPGYLDRPVAALPGRDGADSQPTAAPSPR